MTKLLCHNACGNVQRHGPGFLYCSEACTKQAARRLEATRQREQRHRLVYHLTDEQMYVLWMAQEGCCAICRVPLSTWNIDHDHACCPGVGSCGRCVRGLLCFGCNSRLLPQIEGPLHAAALRYLEAHRGK